MRILLADGTEYLNAKCGVSGGVLVCWITGATMNGAFADFSDPEKTAYITFEYDAIRNTYTGYTRIIDLLDNRYEPGEITISLVREVE